MEGTWGSSGVPQEFLVFMLCREFKCTPRQLREDFSLYEQRYFVDFLQEYWKHNAE